MGTKVERLTNLQKKKKKKKDCEVTLERLSVPAFGVVNLDFCTCASHCTQVGIFFTVILVGETMLFLSITPSRC
jgi:hypothetical protein